MDYFVYAATSLSILAALTSLLVLGVESRDRRSAHRPNRSGLRTLPIGFAVAGVGVILLFGAALPRFHAMFDDGLVAAIGAVLVLLGIGFAIGTHIARARATRPRRARPVRTVPRLSDL
ncbi:MAG: hypothetical protein AAFV19_01555 [Pseudomonadota bacterium]